MIQPHLIQPHLIQRHLIQSSLETRAGSPAAVGVRTHCRRTAAVAKLIAHHLFLASEEKDLLGAACLLHHRNTSPSAMAEASLPESVRGVLSAYNLPGRGTKLECRLAGMVRLADAFDQHMEAQPIEGEEVGQILERLRGGVEASLWPAEAIDALEQATLPPPMVPEESWRIPVFPQAALRMLSLMRNPRANLADVAEASSLDPVTAGLIMRLANSALYGPRTPVSTLSSAIARLGFATAQKAIAAAALHPVFSSSRLQEVWRHSLQVADLSEQLASHAGRVEPGEAYLAGLVHDVGRIAMLSMPLYDSARLEGLMCGGCPQVYVENLLLRTDHAALGAQIAEGWRLPETMISAIRQHHRPEKTEGPLAYLLYLAEYLSGSEEDLPSIIRLEASLKGIGLSWDDIGQCRVSALGSWLAAA